MSHRLASWLLAALAVASFVVLAPVHAAADLISSAPASVPASAAETATVSSTPASIAVTGAGASLWASGSQVCMGTNPILVP